MKYYLTKQVHHATDINDLRWHYIRRGGFPSLNRSNYDEDTAYAVLNNIYDLIILRDVVERYKIRNIELLNRIMKYVMDNLGNTFSAKNISDYFKSQHREFESLLAIKDHYPKYVVSMDEHFTDNIEGVRHISLYKFSTSKIFI